MLGDSDVVDGFVGIAARFAGVFSGDEVADAGIAVEFAASDEGDEDGATGCERSLAGDWLCFGGSLAAIAAGLGLAGPLVLGWLWGPTVAADADFDWLAAFCGAGVVDPFPS